jgi:hypothetical protein
MLAQPYTLQVDRQPEVSARLNRVGPAPSYQLRADSTEHARFAATFGTNLLESRHARFRQEISEFIDLFRGTIPMVERAKFCAQNGFGGSLLVIFFRELFTAYVSA